MSVRLERIARMKPDDRYDAVAAFIESAATSAEMYVEYRRGRHADTERRERMIVVGVARNDNGTSFGELIVQPHERLPHHLRGISLANVQALETTP